MLKKSSVILSCILAGIVLFGTILLSSCGSTPIAESDSTPKAKNGDNVQINYTLTLADGTLFETSVGNEPLEFVLGEGDYLPDFEKAIVGMKVGESKTITILAANAYGAPSNDLIFTVDRSQLAERVDPKVGEQLQSMDENGQILVAVITAVSDTTITLDTNHPLAGKDLTFKIDLLKIS